MAVVAWAGTLIVLVVLVFAVNLVVQSFMPTRTSDPLGHRISYRVMVRVVLFVIAALIVAVTTRIGR